MQSFRIRLFGYPQLLDGEKQFQVERRKTLALLAYLARNAGGDAVQGCGRDTLAALFWPDCSQEQAASYLRQALWDFNKAGGKNWIIKEGQVLSLNPQMNIWVDANAFESTVSSWRVSGSNAPQVLPLLEEAANMVRGDFLAGFTLRDCPAFDEWQSLQTEQLRMYYGQVLEALVGLHSVQRDFAAATRYAHRWLEVDPLNEPAHRALMQLHEANGQRNAALHQYETCVSLLKDDLGVEPEAETLALYRRIRAGQPLPVMPATLPIEQAPHLLTPSRPTGLVTFLFTDIEGSTRLWEQYPQAMPGAHSRQETIIRQVMAAHGGYVYKMIGDAFQVAFSTAPNALAAALAAQRALQAENWGEVGSVKVRMALHTCVTEERDDDYVGPELNRVARLMSAGHGGQVLLSQSAYKLVNGNLPSDVSLCDMGEWFLKDLVHAEHIYQLVASGIVSRFPPLKTAGPRPKLPTPNTPFIGRQAELAQIETLLCDPACRLITLVGIGGTGKTRLALQSAGQSQAFQGRTYFAGLAAITSLDDLIPVLAEAVKFSFHTPPGSNPSLIEAQTQLLNYLADKKLLFVLDNFEQMMDCATFLAEILESAPDIKLLVTSRERLNLPGEWVIEIVGLAFPGKQEREAIPQYDAVQMFVKVAARNGHFAVTDSDWPFIARICQFLEGMPLGIEMAATWTKMLSCEEIAAEMERNLDFLTATWRGMPERHQTLRLVFDYSWRLLGETEQTAFCKLAIFQAGFTREAALEVGSASLPILTILGDKSFVRRVSSGRFDIHPVLKQYAGEKLAERPMLLADIRARHARYYSAWLCRIYAKLKDGEQHSALVALQTEAQNLRLARQELLELRDFEHLERVLPAILLFDVMNDQQIETREMARWLLALEDLLQEETAPSHDSHPGLYALTLAALKWRRPDNQDQERIAYYQQASLQLAETLPDCESKAFAYLLNCIGAGLAPQQGIALSQQCIEIFQRLHDPWGVAVSQMILADTVNFTGVDENLARQAYQASLDIFAGLQNDWGQALCYTGLTFLEHKAGHFEEAYQIGQQSLELLIRIRNFERLLEVRHLLGESAIALAQPAAARQYFRCNLAYFLQTGDQSRIAYYTERLARMGVR